MSLFSAICKNSHYPFKVYHFETKSAYRVFNLIILRNLPSLEDDLSGFYSRFRGSC